MAETDPMIKGKIKKVHIGGDKHKPSHCMIEVYEHAGVFTTNGNMHLHLDALATNDFFKHWSPDKHPDYTQLDEELKGADISIHISNTRSEIHARRKE